MSPTQITHARTVVLPVSDQDRARAFFTDALGFEVRIDAEFRPGERWIEVAPPGAQTTIALTPSAEAGRGGAEVSFATRDADADHAALLEHGVDADPEVIRMGDVPAMFTFRDPDGNRFRMVEIPRSG